MACRVKKVQARAIGRWPGDHAAFLAHPATIAARFCAAFLARISERVDQQDPLLANSIRLFRKPALQFATQHLQSSRKHSGTAAHSRKRQQQTFIHLIKMGVKRQMTEKVRAHVRVTGRHQALF